MFVHVQRPESGAPYARVTQIAVLGGRSRLEPYVSRPDGAISHLPGCSFRARVQNVWPGMEAAFVRIGTPRNAVMYRGDGQCGPGDVDEKSWNLRPEQLLRAQQTAI